MHCEELDLHAHVTVNRWTPKAKHGILRWDLERAVDDIMRRTYNDYGSNRTAGLELMTLLRDAGAVIPAEPAGFEILTSCYCPREIFRATSAAQSPQARERSSLALRAGLLSDPRISCGGEAGAGRMRGYVEGSISEQVHSDRSSQTDRYLTRRHRLGREVFPQMCAENGIRYSLPERAPQALCRCFRIWEEKEGLDLDFIEDMIWEFGRHPGWSRSSNKSAWEVFLCRKGQLIALVAHHRARIGVSGLHQDKAQWLERAPSKRHDREWFFSRTRRAVSL
jgi:hypothetical protein